MADPGVPHSKLDKPLYSSRLLKSYVEYVKKFHLGVDTESVLKYAGITNYELEDQGHWFSQRQVDRFHEILIQKTGDLNISREVGRYAASSEAHGAVKQYALGFVSPRTAYWVLEKIAPHLSKASTLKTTTLKDNRIEVTATPIAGIVENPAQCENRIGMLESLSKLFTNKFANIEHPICIHKGGDSCRYIITWEQTPYFIWRRIRNYCLLIGVLPWLVSAFLIPNALWIPLSIAFCLLIVGISCYAEHLEKGELKRNIQSHGDAARLLIDQINMRYNDALLVSEIGQATSMFLDAKRVLKSVVQAMEKRLDFDRGGIWLANQTGDRLEYQIGYGYDKKIELLVRRSEFHLGKPYSRGIAILAFREQKPFLVNDISEIEEDLSERSLRFVKQMGSQSFICVPIVHESKSLGVLFIDNMSSKRSLSQSDMSLSMGIASQIASSIHNAMSYQQLEESKERERNLRMLFEKYVPAPIIKRYINSNETDLLIGEELPISLFFLDIRNFTAHTESMKPIEVVNFLNGYFEKCANIIIEENGHINKYTGDGFLAIFGAPESRLHHLISAFNAAYRILKLSGSIELGWKPMEVGIGLCSGKAIVGNIGSESKIEYTAIGDTVNTAARLQDFTKRFLDFPIIMDKEAWIELSGHPFHRKITRLGSQRIRGKKGTVEIFGYRPSKEDHSSNPHPEGGFSPLHRINGV